MVHAKTFSKIWFTLVLAWFLPVTAVLAQRPQSSVNDASLLASKRWTLASMDGRKFTASEPYLEFDLNSKRVSGSGGCNRFSGGFEINGSNLKFAALASTRRACVDSERQRVETSFLKHLETTTRYEIDGHNLRLFANNVSVLVLRTKDASSDIPTAQHSLGGTSWRLVKFQGSDGSTLTPGKSQYTITFERDGRVTARIDCNRGNSTWKSSGLAQIQFGPLATTRAMCPPGSLYNRIVKDWPAVRSYTLQAGRLFLGLMADGGIYMYEPISGAAPNEGSVTGTISYRQRIALSPQAIVEVKLVDISRADAPSTIIAEQIIRPEGRQVPIPFDLRYDLQRIDRRKRYSVQARILEGDTLKFISKQTYRVLTGGYGKSAQLILHPVPTQNK